MKFLLSVISIIVSLLVDFGTGQSDGPQLTIPQGQMVGSYATSRDGRPYYMFRAVPYGQFPRRFDLSTLAGPWEGILNATASGPGCINANEFGTTGPYGVEDCLNLDISTPSLPNDANFTGPLPVMVWIAGGGFTLGTSIGYGSKYFMDEDVVLVAVNYRLGAFGMLNAGVEGARGNQALKDITIALKWIQANINFFGGDPNTVTIFGESTGGGTASLLTLSPMTQGLFHRAIMMSGVASCPQTILHANPGIKNAKLLAAELDCPTRDLDAMVECLRNTPALEIANLSRLTIDEFAWKEEGIHLGPTIETFSSGPDDASIFISEDPLEIADRGDFQKVPMMIGHMRQEGLYKMTAFLSNADFVEKLNAQMGRLFPEWLLYYDAAVDPCAVTGKIKEYYFKNENVTLDLVEEFELLVGDALMNHCTRKMVHSYSKYTDVYMYSFIRPKSIDPDQWPASHGDDLYYMFNSLPEAGMEPYNPEIKPGDGDYQFSKDLVKVLVNFARDGAPGSWGTTVWTPLEEAQLFNVLQIDSEQPFMMPVTPEYMDSWKFWDSLNLKVIP